MFSIPGGFRKSSLPFVSAQISILWKWVVRFETRTSSNSYKTSSVSSDLQFFIFFNENSKSIPVQKKSNFGGYTWYDTLDWRSEIMLYNDFKMTDRSTKWYNVRAIGTGQWKKTATVVLVPVSSLKEVSSQFPVPVTRQLNLSFIARFQFGLQQLNWTELNPGA